MDVKLGTQLWGEDSSEAKRQRLTIRAIETTSHKFGIRVTAYQVYHKSTDSYFNFTKDDGYSIVHDADVIISVLAKFFTAEIPISDRRLILKRFINDLEFLVEDLEKQDIIFVGASLFFVYEGDPDALAEALKKEQEIEEADKNEEQDGEINIENVDDYVEEEEDSDSDDENILRVADLKMIDFAHSIFREGVGKHEGTLFGINNLINYLKIVLKEKKYR